MPIADTRSRAISETRQRGRIWARPPPRGLPRLTAQRSVGRYNWRLFAFLRVRLRSLSFLLSLYYVYEDGLCQKQAGQASGPKPLRVAVFFSLLSKSCCLGGGSLGGGDPVSPRCLGPPRSTPKGCGAAHGPRHPAYLLLLG